MRKFAITTATIIVMMWLRLALSGHSTEAELSIPGSATLVWLCTFGLYFAWKVFLLMVRQLGSAVRGN